MKSVLSSQGVNAAEQKVIDMGSLSRNSLFIYLAVLGLCCCKGSFLVVVRGAPLLQCTDFSLQWFLLRQSTDSRAGMLQKLCFQGSRAQAQ